MENKWSLSFCRLSRADSGIIPHRRVDEIPDPTGMRSENLIKRMSEILS
jgi:hypothetical protein